MAQSFERALVTGASGGIGAAIARELASRGCELVLIARSAGRLHELADDLGEEHDIATQVLVADLLTGGGVAAVIQRLDDTSRPVDLLVNNAGFGAATRFVEMDADNAASQIELNVTALVRLTHAVLPRLIADGRGGILNVSSVGGFQPVPLMAVYAATKAFVTSFTEAVHEEVRGTGVHVTTLCPGFTRTEFAQVAGAEEAASRIPDVLWQEPGPVAAAGVDGVERGRSLVVPGNLNKIAAAISQMTPSSVSRRIVGRGFGALG